MRNIVVVGCATCLTALFLGGLAGCGQKPETGSGKTGAQSAAPPATQSAADLAAVKRMTGAAGSPTADKLPPGHPAVDGSGMPPATMPPGQSAEPAAVPEILKFDAPATWKAQPPSTMSLQRYAIPKAGDDPTDGDARVFFFSNSEGRGGQLDAIVAMWIAQFTDANGQAVPASASRTETVEVGGLKATTVDVTGYFGVSPAMGGSGKRSDTEHKLLGVIVALPEGNWMIKAVGPKATMEAARGDFEALVKSLRKP